MKTEQKINYVPMDPVWRGKGRVLRRHSVDAVYVRDTQDPEVIARDVEAMIKDNYRVVAPEDRYVSLTFNLPKEAALKVRYGDNPLHKVLKQASHDGVKSTVKFEHEGKKYRETLDTKWGSQFKLESDSRFTRIMDKGAKIFYPNCSKKIFNGQKPSRSDIMADIGGPICLVSLGASLAGVPVIPVILSTVGVGFVWNREISRGLHKIADKIRRH